MLFTLFRFYLIRITRHTPADMLRDSAMLRFIIERLFSPALTLLSSYMIEFLFSYNIHYTYIIYLLLFSSPPPENRSHSATAYYIRYKR